MRILCEPVAVADMENSNPPSVAIETSVASQLADLELRIMSDYYTGFNRKSPVSQVVSAEKYLYGKGTRWSDTSLLCPEMPIPLALASSVKLVNHGEGVWSERAVAVIHAGRSHCVSPIHFDWDHAWVAHACLSGRKRFVLFSPKAGWLLNPIINTSALAIPKFSESDRRELLEKIGGVEIVLEAGQGILFPSMFWHGVLYDEPSLAVSVRFEGTAGGRPFAVLPRSWLLQRLLWRFFERGYGRESCDFLSEYLKSFFTRSKTWKENYRRIMSLCRQALLARGEEQGAFEYVAENFSAEMALASEELKLYYGNVNETVSRGRNQLREVREYIFEGLDCGSSAQELLLSRYALCVRQGLPPKRGLVQIDQEISI